MYSYLIAYIVCVCVCGGGGGGGGYSDIFIRSGHFFWFKILKSIFLGGFQKNDCFSGYEDFVDIFFGSSQNWTIIRGHFYALT